MKNFVLKIFIENLKIFLTYAFKVKRVKDWKSYS